ncbi:MAG TPA: hypothetical protein VMI06_08700 [Terriglobia bacterium]|nr:hypothetical protein [Terriglobia bacterium]
MITVELVYDRNCPNADRARANLLQALAAAAQGVSWIEWERDAPGSPARVKGYGSPTVLVDGKDVAGSEDGEGGPRCRLYRNATNNFDGSPSVEKIAAALTARDRALVEMAGSR